MPADFRASLYRGYVSSFKGEPDLGSGQSVAWWDHKYLPLLRQLDPTAPILDLGCGSGGLLAHLARRGFSDTLGVDISAEQVALARERGVRAECADLFPFLAARPAAFAAILAIDVLEHLSRDELIELAPLVYASLEPGGLLLVQTANGAGLFARQVMYGDLTHLTIFTPQTLAQLLRPVGFAGFAYYETGPIPIRLRGKLDVAMWSLVKSLANRVRRIESGKTQSIWTENFICRAIKPAR